MTTEPTLTDNQRRLLTRQGFIERYYANCAHLAPQEAYQATERQHEAITGQTKYKGWESFKVVKNKFITSTKKR